MLMFFCSLLVRIVCCLSLTCRQPLSLGFFLILNSLLVTITVGAIRRRLLGFLFFITYVGGVIVLFLYVLSIYPNEIYEGFVKFQSFIFIFTLIAVFLIFLSCFMFSFTYSNDKNLVFFFIRLNESWDIYIFFSIIFHH